MISLRRRPPEEPTLDAETKAWYQEVITIESPFASLLPPGTVDNERKMRFFVLQCPHCKCIHADSCPAVKSIEQYENGNIKRVVFHENWDRSLVVTFEMVFSDNEQDSSQN